MLFRSEPIRLNQPKYFYGQCLQLGVGKQIKILWLIQPDWLTDGWRKQQIVNRFDQLVIEIESRIAEFRIGLLKQGIEPHIQLDQFSAVNCLGKTYVRRIAMRVVGTHGQTAAGIEDKKPTLRQPERHHFFGHTLLRQIIDSHQNTVNDALGINQLDQVLDFRPNPPVSPARNRRSWLAAAGGVVTPVGAAAIRAPDFRRAARVRAGRKTGIDKLPARQPDPAARQPRTEFYFSCRSPAFNNTSLTGSVYAEKISHSKCCSRVKVKQKTRHNTAFLACPDWLQL